ncbi:conserved hypothetical protein [Perkinsus marinus ATCC 50983]|uniref:Uncharacterized protein n=1 Tax=Perkinsus marinus (strain ATCC 50983 / TXsc) TaxID=423536 RepID=C5KKL7_PERM5|nr:conserved hypothetical protein [Perkinsus marinus ATCC 50983]EER15129.1 conserved hypothetical protein [Perkinsus marinus ATCC 50983]|eukprot:XP_002783333.1 conserved hypothetical protein [Perkinsus marinus ATCC 50983]
MAPKRKSTGRGGGAGRSNKRAKGTNATGGSSSVVLPELEAPLFGDDLMIDDEDRQKLKEMTEVEREAVFNERYEQLVRYRERKKALERLKAKGVTTLPASRSPKKSKAGEESDAESESSESSSGESESGSSSGDDNDDDEEEASSGSSESESSSGEESDAEEDEEGVDAGNKETVKDSRKHEKALVATKARQEELTLPMARKMLVTRQLCFEYVQLPEKLRDSVLTGSFCRLQTTFQNTSGNSSGQMDTTADGGDGYMMAEITGLKALDKPVQVRIPTTNGAIKVMTLHHNLAIRLLSGVAAMVPVTCLSNQPISEVELQLWTAAVGPDHAQEVALSAPKKIKELQEGRRFEWTSENIDKYIAKKHGGQSVVSTSLAMEESQLVTKIEALMQKLQNPELSQMDRSEIEIQLNKEETRLKEVTQEIKANQQKFQAENQRLRRVQEINRRNLELQQQTDLEMAKRRARQLGTTTKGGAKKGGMNGGSLNPYERRECRPTMLWDVGGHREGAAGDDDDSKPSSPDKRQQQQQQDQASSKDAKMSKTKSRFDRMLEVYRSVDPLNSIIKVQSLLSRVENENGKQHLLDEVRHARALGPADTSKSRSVSVLPLWSQQLPSAAGRQPRGEIMTFKEWQQRVEEQTQQAS